MWYEYLNNNKELLKIYKNIPRLIDIRIEKIEILKGGCDAIIGFDMPKFAEYPHKKWHKEDNVVYIEIAVNDIKNIMIKVSSNLNEKNNKIDITKNINGIYFVEIVGSIEAQIYSTSILLESISSYQMCNENEL